MISDNKNYSREVGSLKELQAAEFLKENGIDVLETNFRCRMGEIDIIARDGPYLLFAEVKYRHKKTTGPAEEAVDYSKQKKICRASDFYLIKKRLYDDTPMRYDVIAIDQDGLRWYKNAFEYIPVKRRRYY